MKVPAGWVDEATIEFSDFDNGSLGSSNGSQRSNAGVKKENNEAINESLDKSSSKKVSKKSHSKNQDLSKGSQKAKSKVLKNSSKKLSKTQKIKNYLRPETKKRALRRDPLILEANWPTVDVLIIVQTVISFIFLFNALLLAALGFNGALSCVFFAILLFITALPSLILVAKGEVESAICAYSVLQLICVLFGYCMLLSFFFSDDDLSNDADFYGSTKSTYSLHIILWLVIIWQSFATIFMNWAPYRQVKIK